MFVFSRIVFSKELEPCYESWFHEEGNGFVVFCFVFGVISVFPQPWPTGGDRSSRATGRVTALPPQVQSTTEPDGTHSPNPSASWGLEGVTHRCFQRSFPAYYLGFLSPDPRTPRVMMGEGAGPRAAFMSHVPL